MIDAGRDLAAPKRSDAAGWQALTALLRARRLLPLQHEPPFTGRPLSYAFNHPRDRSPRLDDRSPSRHRDLAVHSWLRTRG
ncbi:hypothetical protein [Kitasatospora sp. MMS16-BH015]|uniref:hypothetical protein n=1 Tax=Kitasatospora sp. MMS16-BH015 TaxID=2018025 RepID=UPI00143D69A6|nr:hypothetical protein [Kitasatospora sp. MMS16-BH015]